MLEELMQDDKKKDKKQIVQTNALRGIEKKNFKEDGRS
jgi:hypothetical protein